MKKGLINRNNFFLIAAVVVLFAVFMRNMYKPANWDDNEDDETEEFLVNRNAAPLHPYRRYANFNPFIAGNYIGGYSDTFLPADVMHCNTRREPCYGGSQNVVPHYSVPLNIGSGNIAPVSATINSDHGNMLIDGLLYKVYGSENDVLKLLKRPHPTNRNHYEYYTMIGKHRDVLVPVLLQRPSDELGTNDIVRVQGLEGEYRVSTYDDHQPRYVPFTRFD